MRISDHAWGQMKIRGLSRKDVKYCFNNRMDESQARGDCIKIMGQTPSGKNIVIIYDVVKKQVVTTYPLI